MQKVISFINRSKKEYLRSKERGTILEVINPNAKIKKEIFPFEHIIIDNAFNELFYTSFCKYYEKVVSRGFSERPDSNFFYPFKYVTGYLEKYGGYFYPPKWKEDTAMDFFFSHTWNTYIENLCNTDTNFFISTTLHLHTKSNKDGWVHNDNQEVFFHKDDMLSNGMIFQNNNRKEFTHTTKRNIAVIYYFNNDNWKEGDGGETGIYKNPKGQPVSKVAPISNRILIFKIQPNSYHAFLGNKVERNALVQWFHKEQRSV